MNLGDFNEEVSYLLGGDPANLMTVCKFANKGMNVLANRYDTACLKNEIVITCTDVYSEYPLPDDCIGVFKIKDMNGIKYDNYFISYGEITFGQTNDFTISYYSVPVMPVRDAESLDLKTDILPINSNYDKCLTKYIACEILKYTTATTYKYRGLYRYMIDPRIADYTTDFMQESAEAYLRLRRTKRSHMIIKAPMWR